MARPAPAAAEPRAHRRRRGARWSTPRAWTRVSTRRLAAELGVRGPSLYNHFATKDEILDAVADAIVGAGRHVMLRPTHDWREALRRWARSYRAALLAHPNIVPFLAQGPGRRPAALRHGRRGLRRPGRRRLAARRAPPTSAR